MASLASLWRWLRALVYDWAIVWFTASWYRIVLEALPEDARVLDVGIGTAAALVANANLVRRKRLTIVGVDIDAAYVERAQYLLRKNRLNTSVAGQMNVWRRQVMLQSVYDHRGGPYDAIYFSGSFMLLPDRTACLKHLLPQLKPEGRIYFTQNFQLHPSPMLEVIKPLLALVTTIDFGSVTYPAAFLRHLQDAGLTVNMEEVISTSAGRTAKMVVASRE